MKFSWIKAKKKPETKQLNLEESESILGDKLNFAASEAYKLLRTNLTFMMDQEHSCHVIGVTSATRGEGKSTTSINLSYTLAEAGNRVLLIEGDMRLPAVASRLNITAGKGLSNLLVGQTKPDEILHSVEEFSNSTVKKNWKVLTGGELPPNPAELLASEAMKRVIQHYSENFDFIVIDLPPILAVSDALAVSAVTDGIVMVVRQGYAQSSSVKEAVRQFQFSKCKLLGFIMTCAGTEESKFRKYSRYGHYGRYGKYGKYGRYGKYSKYGYSKYGGYGGYGEGYGYGYGYGYGKTNKAENAESAQAEKTDAESVKKKNKQ